MSLMSLIAVVPARNMKRNFIKVVITEYINNTTCRQTMRK